MSTQHTTPAPLVRIYDELEENVETHNVNGDFDIINGDLKLAKISNLRKLYKTN